LLRSVDEIEFSILREALGISDVSLSKHLKVLTDAGFVKTTKSVSATRNDSRRLIWVKLTASGRKSQGRQEAFAIDPETPGSPPGGCRDRPTLASTATATSSAAQAGGRPTFETGTQQHRETEGAD
jgi:hypothetical protein